MLLLLSVLCSTGTPLEKQQSPSIASRSGKKLGFRKESSSESESTLL